MRKGQLLAALLVLVTLASAAPATAATKIVVERIESLSGREPLDDGGGGGYPGCWRAYITASGSHWSGSSWSHHFNPAWCGNGSVVTSVDPSWHYQSTSGFYGTRGVSHWTISGCVGCPSIRFHAQGRFSFSFWGWNSHFDDDRFITLYGSNGRIGP
jgi:hypothetical protein